MTSMRDFAPPAALLHRFDMPGPGPATYPAGNRYAAAFGADDCLRALRQRGSGAVAGGLPLAVHLHVPFCESLCATCACSPVVTRRHGRAADYVAALEHEIALAAAAMGTRQVVSRLHVGGGTPLFLSDGELARLAAALRDAFAFAHDADLSIEVDARVATRARLANLRVLGFGRIGLHLEGFDARVQACVNRVQSHRAVRELVDAARELGFDVVHAEVLFGLPRQTPDSFAGTVREIVQLRPERVTLARYEHAPQRHRAQRTVLVADLPADRDRLAMQAIGIDGLVAAGYAHVGLDDFARAADPLLTAKRQGRLQRDLQGFGTRPEGDVLALGASATGRIGASHYRNAAGLTEYYDALNHDELPVACGLQLTRDELARRAVIMAIVCQGRVDFESVGLSHLIDVRQAFTRELAELAGLARGGLVEMDDEGFQLTRTGAWFARNVAGVFDRETRREVRRDRLAQAV